MSQHLDEYTEIFDEEESTDDNKTTVELSAPDANDETCEEQEARKTFPHMRREGSRVRKATEETERSSRR